MRFLILSFLAFCLIRAPLIGQVSYQASYYNGVGNPAGLNDEAEFSTVGWTPILPGGLMNNQWSNSASVPFYFEFFGQSVSNFKASANGVLTFDLSASSVPGNNGVIPNPALPNLSISCFWEAFSLNPPTGTNDQVQYKTFGTAPNRQFWVRWASFEWGPSSFAYVAIVLEESTFDVHIVDMYSSLTSNWITSSVGVQKDVGFGVMIGDVNTPLSGAGSSPNDNSYFTFEPYPIPPQDVKPVAVLSLPEIGCGLGQEDVSISLTNIGQLTAGQIQAAYSLDGGIPTTLETVVNSLPSGDTLLFTFSAKADVSTPGPHSLQIWTSTNGDGYTANDTLTFALTNVLKIGGLPYQEDFESGEGGWTSGGTNNSWEWGTPSNSVIQGGASGTKAWVTGRTGSHNSFENSWAISPCIDLSSANPDTWVGMNVWWDCEANWDGAALQASADGGEFWLTVGGFGSSDWYNQANINSLPGGQAAGWSGSTATGTGSGSWVPVTHRLPPGLVGHSSVRFRLVFSSGGAQNGDGFAFDDFTLGTPPTVDLGPHGYYCNSDLIDAGNPNMTYVWSNGASTQTVELYNYGSGTIVDSLLSVQVINDLGLFRRDSLIFSLGSPMNVSSLSSTDLICAGEPSGNIQVQISGGLTPLSYAWSHGSQDQNPVLLGAGSYVLTVTDANDCEFVADTVWLSEPAPLELAATVLDVSCHNDSNGSISALGSGGVGPYSYTWSHGTSGDLVQNLIPGTYVLSLTDDNNCELQEVYVIENPDSLDAEFLTVQDASCRELADGQINLAVNGGTAPYTYLWSNGSTDEDPQSLEPGLYSVEITDSQGCSWEGDSLTIGYDNESPMANFGFSIDGMVVTFLDSSALGTSYYWLLGNGVHSTIPAPIYTYPQPGEYLVRLVVSNACGSDTTEQQIRVGITSRTEPLASNAFRVFPNPAEGEFILQWETKLEGESRLRLLSLEGKTILEQFFSQQSGRELRIDVPPGLAKGLYLIQLDNEHGRWTDKITLR